jgi:hypothetical protein
MLFPLRRRFILCAISASYVEEFGCNRTLEDTRGLGEGILYQIFRKRSLDPPNKTPFHVSSRLAPKSFTIIPRDNPWPEPSRTRRTPL